MPPTVSTSQISHQLTSFHLNRVAVKQLSLPWLRPIKCSHIRADGESSDGKDRSRRPINLFWLVAATGNWHTSQPPLSLDEMRSIEIRWSEVRLWYEQSFTIRQCVSVRF